MVIKNKVFLVTGAAAGIGAGVTRALVEKGAKHVAALDIDVAAGETLQKDLNDKYGKDKVLFIKCDVTEDLHSAFDEAARQLGYIDVVINNAGIMNDAPHIYEKEIAINVTALITSSLKALNRMRKDRGGKGGTIINVSSIIALLQGPNLPIYGATKSAVLQFSNCLGRIENYSRTDVRVIAICFGITDTKLIRGRIGGIDEAMKDTTTDDLEQLPSQSVESAVQGLVTALEIGKSGSTWLVSADKPAEDITGDVTKAYEILGRPLLAQYDADVANKLKYRNNF